MPQGTVEGARLAQEQLDLLRRLVAGGLSVPDFIAPFLTARNDEIDAGGCHDLALLALFEDIWFAIEMYNDLDDLWKSNASDDAHFVVVLTHYLADWDAGLGAERAVGRVKLLRRRDQRRSFSRRDDWCQRQVALTRQFVALEIDADEYGCKFMWAHNAGARAHELSDDAMDVLRDDLLYAVSNHSEEPDRTWPDQLDDEQLRVTVARHLAEWDDGTYAASWWDR